MDQEICSQETNNYLRTVPRLVGLRRQCLARSFGRCLIAGSNPAPGFYFTYVLRKAGALPARVPPETSTGVRWNLSGCFVLCLNPPGWARPALGRGLVQTRLVRRAKRGRPSGEGWLKKKKEIKKKTNQSRLGEAGLRAGPGFSICHTEGITHVISYTLKKKPQGITHVISYTLKKKHQA